MIKRRPDNSERDRGQDIFNYGPSFFDEFGGDSERDSDCTKEEPGRMYTIRTFRRNLKKS